MNRSRGNPGGPESSAPKSRALTSIASTGVVIAASALEGRDGALMRSRWMSFWDPHSRVEIDDHSRSALTGWLVCGLPLISAVAIISWLIDRAFSSPTVFRCAFVVFVWILLVVLRDLVFAFASVGRPSHRVSRIILGWPGELLLLAISATSLLSY